MNKESILQLLQTVPYPGYSRDIISFGIIKEVIVEGKDIQIFMDLTTSNEKVVEEIESAIIKKLKMESPDFNVKVNNNPSSASKTGKDVNEDYLPDVKNKIAVASGKGGVGKSTVSVNLAIALAELGNKVGLLDADIYGPSIPLMLGVKSTPEYRNKKLNPIKKYGINIMSLGFLVDTEDAVIWRGPLVTRAIQQLMQDVNWGELDYMIFDLPPGTGDAQLTLSQSIQLDGAVIVSTPQDVALIDAVKGVNMFKKVNVPILGVIENMSYFSCPHCGERSDIFASGGVKRECDRNKVRLLGEIPLDIAIRQGGDSGKPVVVNKPDNDQTKIFMEIAKKISGSIK